jgi:hypothetical protein
MKINKLIRLLLLSVLVASALAVIEDKYITKVPGGLTFAEFRGYESWQAISMSRSERVVDVILGNAAMIGAYRDGIPGNAKPFPNGAKMAKIHWAPKPNEFFPERTVPGKRLRFHRLREEIKLTAQLGSSHASRSKLRPSCCSIARL